MCSAKTIIRYSIRIFGIYLLFLTLSKNSYASVVGYNITTTHSYAGYVSGDIFGSGTTLTSFDVISQNGLNSYEFNSNNNPYYDSGVFFSSGNSTGNGTPVSEIEMTLSHGYPSPAYFIDFYVTGNFSTGLQYVGGDPYYVNGNYFDSFGLAGVTTYENSHQSYLTAADVKFTKIIPQSVPEPSSLSILLFLTMLLFIIWIKPFHHRH